MHLRKLRKSDLREVLVIFKNSHFPSPDGREQFPRTPTHAGRRRPPPSRQGRSAPRRLSSRPRQPGCPLAHACWARATRVKTVFYRSVVFWRKSAGGPRGGWPPGRFSPKNDGPIEHSFLSLVARAPPLFARAPRRKHQKKTTSYLERYARLAFQIHPRFDD
jgi:hypothetical protein